MTYVEEACWWLIEHPLTAALATFVIAAGLLGSIALRLRGTADDPDDVAVLLPARAGGQRVDQLPDAGADRRRLRLGWRDDLTVPMPPVESVGADLEVTRRLSCAAYGMAHAVPPAGAATADNDHGYRGRHHRRDSEVRS